MKDILRLEKLSFAWPEQAPLLKDIDLRVHETDIIGVSGRNGSGKSTLLACIVGLLREWEGKIFLEEEEISSPAAFQKLRRKVCLCLQNASDQLIFPIVIEDIAFGPQNLGYADAHGIARNILQSLRIDYLAERRTDQLSGGQTRLVAIAAMLAMRPKLLLLDEPFAGLDMEAAEILVSTLSTFPCAKLIVHHDQTQLTAICNRRYTLEGGLLKEL